LRDVLLVTVALALLAAGPVAAAASGPGGHAVPAVRRDTSTQRAQATSDRTGTTKTTSQSDTANVNTTSGNGTGTGTRNATNATRYLLVVQNASTRETLLAVPVSNGTFVALIYTHSVEKTRVLDGYTVNGTSLEMTRMEFESYGAGLPAQVHVNRTANGSFVFDPPGSYTELYVKPGRVAGHVLTVGNRTYDLVALSNAHTVRLSVAPRTGAVTPTANVSANGTEATVTVNATAETTNTTPRPSRTSDATTEQPATVEA